MSKSRVVPGLLLVAVVCWAVWYVRPIRQVHRLGLTWRGDVSGVHCSTHERETMCTSIGSMPPPAYYTTVQFNPWTRAVHRVNRTWALADSERWSVKLDSVRRAMIASGGRRAMCDSSETGFPIAEAWRFGGYETRLYAGRVPVKDKQLPWYASVQLVPWGSVGCGREVHYVLLTPSQVAQHVQEWLADHLGF